MDVLQEAKRDSLREPIDENGNKEAADKPPPPQDKWFLVRVMVFFLGMTSLLSATFVSTAFNYWMWKFRNTSIDADNSTQRTPLQTTFLSSMGIAMTVPSAFTLIFALTVAHKIKSRLKITVCYSGLTACFSVLTVFVKIDTDAWQQEFFAITLVIMAIISVLFVILSSSLIVAVPKLPSEYMKIFMYGQGVSGVVSSLLQIISLTIGDTSQKVGLIYFGCGTILFGLSLGIYIMSKYLPMYQYYVNENKETTKKPMPKLSEMKDVFLRIWPCLAVQSLNLLCGLLTHTTITSLIVSERYGNHDEWSEKYFVPVITFLYSDVAGTVGRVFASGNLTSKNTKWFIIGSIARIFIFLPLFAFCNVNTSSRKLTPIFTHDWEYVLILSAYVLSSGYIATVAMLSVPNFKKEEDPMDLYYLMIQVTLMGLAMAASPLSLVVLKFL